MTKKQPVKEKEYNIDGQVLIEGVERRELKKFIHKLSDFQISITSIKMPDKKTISELDEIVEDVLRYVRCFHYVFLIDGDIEGYISSMENYEYVKDDWVDYTYTLADGTSILSNEFGIDFHLLDRKILLKK